MTLEEKFSNLIENHEDLSYFISQYRECDQKYLYALMTDADLGISPKFYPEMSINEEDMEKCSEILTKYIRYWQKKKGEALTEVLEILNKELPLTGVKKIHTYTEFDLLEWNFALHEKAKLKFRPKGVPVSFWNADLKDVIYE